MKRLYIAIPALLATVALGGCTGAGTSASPTGASTASSSTASSASTASSSSTPSSSASKAPSASSTLKPNQEVDAKKLMGDIENAMKGVKTYKLVLKGGENTETTVEYDQTDKNNVKARNNTTLQGKKVETILIGKQGYQKTEPATKYKKVNVPSINPNDLINNALKNGASKAVYVGTETIDGVSATHYTVTVSASTNSVSPSPAGSAAPSSTPSASISVPIDIWVDGSNRFVQQKAELEALGAKVQASNKYTDYDKSLDIKEPAADQIES